MNDMSCVLVSLLPEIHIRILDTEFPILKNSYWQICYHPALIQHRSLNVHKYDDHQDDDALNALIEKL